MRIFRTIILLMALMATTALSAQTITSVHGTVSDDMGPLMGATVCEVDGTGRIINSAITDLNGNFTMKVKNPKDKIRFSYVGLKTQSLAIDRTTYKVHMTSATTLREVTVKSKKRVNGNGLPIPERELSSATQSLSMKEFEGLAITSVEEALQGHIAGLDIIANSGDLGSGSTMRLRGVSTMSNVTSGDPLIVVDGNERTDLSVSLEGGEDLNQKFSELLSINPEDIADIRVLKDGASAAIYGSRGANGVIEITTKRGVRGKPRLAYSLKVTGTYQPNGYKLLNGDDYTMLLKESYFNPQQSDAASNIRELNYDPTFSEYEQYNNNTDWVDAVKQFGLRQQHNLNVSGGGEKAAFRISGSYEHDNGTTIKTSYNRFTTRVALDYKVSDRIRVSTNFSLSYQKNFSNYSGLMDIARKKMPNMGIYEQNPVTGEDTNAYYTMLQSGSSEFNNDQKTYANPVGVAHLAKSIRRAYDMSPELQIKYYLLGIDEDHWQLNYEGRVTLNTNNTYNERYYPQVLTTKTIADGVNDTSDSSSKNVSFNTKHYLTLIPAFKNKDHSAMLMGFFDLSSSTNTSQSENKQGVASGITTTKGGGRITGMSSNFGPNRRMSYTATGHYAYKGRYIADFTIRADGTTVLGKNHRWIYNPSLSGKWIISDEPFMKPTEKWLSMLAVRPSWAHIGNAGIPDFLYTSKYSEEKGYLDMTAMKPANIRLSDLNCQWTVKYNLGFDLGFLKDRLTLTFEVYQETVTDQLMPNYRIPSNSGFKTVPYRNTGKMRNTGWEFYINTNRIIKAGKFSMDMNVNFANNRNEILEMDEYVLNNENSTFGYNNAETLKRVQLHNPLGALYGFRYKGVYQYNYSTVQYMTEEERNEFFASGKTAPVVMNENGEVVLDAQGDPLRMMYNYTTDATGRNYKFCGGDAIYEDVNHDGQINALDIVYLGSSLPKLFGGFGFTFNYNRWRLSTQFVYRIGHKIMNMARLNAEAMISNNNQSEAVNYRWRKEGDITPIPRAMYGNQSNYNTLVSDRYVESGSFLRMNYISLNYSLDKKQLKWIGLSGVSFYLNAQNVFTLTKYTGVEPNNSGAPAIDNNPTPSPHQYTVGINVQF